MAGRRGIRGEGAYILLHAKEEKTSQRGSQDPKGEPLARAMAQTPGRSLRHARTLFSCGSNVSRRKGVVRVCGEVLKLRHDWLPERPVRGKTWWKQSRLCFTSFMGKSS
jgi:hypothetical protein